MSDDFQASINAALNAVADSGETPETNDTPANPDYDGLVPMDEQEVVDEPVAPTKRKFKLKVDGQEFEEEYGDDELVAELQKAKAAAKRMQEAAEERRAAAEEKKQVQDLLKLINQDPHLVMQKTGMTQEQIVDWADRILGAHLENVSMSPEERQRRQDEFELNQLRQERQREREEQEKQQAVQQKQQIREQLEGQLVDAMAQHNLPRDPQVRAIVIQDAIRMYAAEKARAMKAGEAPQMTPEKAVARAVDARQRDQIHLLSKFSDEELYDRLGPDFIKRIRKVDTARHKTKKIPAYRQTQNSAPVKKSIKEEKRVISEDEFESYLNSLKKK